MSTAFCKRRTALSLCVLVAALVPACGDDDATGEPRREPRDAGRDSPVSDAPADVRDQPDSALDSAVDAGLLDGSNGDAADSSERADSGMPEGSTQDAAAEARAEGGADAAGSADAARDAVAVDAVADAGSDAMALADSMSSDSGPEAGSKPDGARDALVFWEVGEDFACEGTRTQVECNDDDFAEAYVITILQSAGNSCAEGPSRITFYFEYGSPPAAGEYVLQPVTTFSDPREARLEIDVNNGAQTWTAQSGHVTVEWLDGAPSLGFSGVPARFGATDTTLSGRVTCPPDN